MSESQDSGRPEKGAAYELELSDGCAVIFLEGFRGKEESESVARELTNYLHRTVHKRGQRHVVIRIPPQVRMTIARGRRIEVQTVGENKVLFKIEDGREDSLIVIPGRA